MKYFPLIFSIFIGIFVIQVTALLLQIRIYDACLLYTNIKSPLLYLFLFLLYCSAKNTKYIFQQKEEYISPYPTEKIIYADQLFAFEAKEPIFVAKENDPNIANRYLTKIKEDKEKEIKEKQRIEEERQKEAEQRSKSRMFLKHRKIGGEEK